MYASVYLAQTDALDDKILYQKALEAVSAERREKISHIRSCSLKKASLGAELLLHRALRDLGIGIKDLGFAYGEHGKPYLKEVPGVYFNLSHSADYVMAAVSDREIGCDLEKESRWEERNLKIARRFYADEEYESIISTGSEQESRALFYRYWTLKESFLKATGRGLSLPMKEARFALDGDKEPVLMQNADPRTFYFSEIRNIPGYSCAVCQTERYCEPVVHHIDLMSEIYSFVGNLS